MSIYTRKAKTWQATNTQAKIDALFTPEQRARFWSKINSSSDHAGCWIWPNLHRISGYGHFAVKGMNFRAHRVAWMLCNGPIPADLHVLHSCDNPSCVNPKHLSLGDPADNAHDRDDKARTQRGSRHYCAKLTEDDVRYIYQSDERPCDLAPRYGVHASAISAIRKGKKWKHITEALSDE